MHIYIYIIYLEQWHIYLYHLQFGQRKGRHSTFQDLAGLAASCGQARLLAETAAREASRRLLPKVADVLACAAIQEGTATFEARRSFASLFKGVSSIWASCVAVPPSKGPMPCKNKGHKEGPCLEPACS